MKYEEGNKIIAKFDGWKLRSSDFVNSDKEHYPWWEKFIDGKVVKTYHHDILNADGKFEWGSYHTSWDWLMPVVEKIVEIDITPAPNWRGYRVEIVPRGYVKIEGFSMTHVFKNVFIEGSLINAVWQAVVQFIQWYNKTKTNG
jgi:hypothetical protein